MNPLSSALGVFLSEWDGLSTSSHSPVIVLGATNRPADIDPAFLRRMPLMIKVSDPDAPAREEILRCLLRKEGSLSESINLTAIAELLEGFTGSDLKEVCRLAGISRMKRIFNERNGGNFATTPSDINHDHLLRNEDFDIAIARMFSIRENHRGKWITPLIELTLNQRKNITIFWKPCIQE
jgi:SpoVK/Ycf46/Vps4 family AAA+-type ATPase